MANPYLPLSTLKSLLDKDFSEITFRHDVLTCR